MTTPTLPEPAKAWVDAPEFATVATVQPDGQPQLSVVWVTRDGDEVLFSTTKGRRKQRNLERDPTVSLLLSPRESPYTYIEIRGRATMTEEGGRELIDDLNEKYTGVRPYPHDEPDAVRVVVRITPERVVFRG